MKYSATMTTGGTIVCTQIRVKRMISLRAIVR